MTTSRDELFMFARTVGAVLQIVEAAPHKQDELGCSEFVHAN
jgi:hypothetical protein